jgi:MFS family permease
MSWLRGLGSGTFASLRHRNYRLYFVGQSVSIAGTWMQNIAAAWLILRLTNSALDVGLLTLCQLGPFVVLGLHGGLVADRFEPRRIVLFTQSVQIPIAAILTVLAFAGDVKPWELYVAGVLTGIVSVFDTPARQALAHSLVGRDGVANAVALNVSLFNSGRVIGPALGGALIAVAGVGWCFAVNTVSFLAVLAALLMMRPSEFFPVVKPSRPPTVWGGTLEALRYVRTDRRMAVTLGGMFIMAMLALNTNVLVPVLARLTLHTGATSFGLVSATNGIGALVGALLAASFARTSWKAFVIAGFVVAVTNLAIAPVRDVIFASLLLFVLGGAQSVLGASANASIQLGARPDLKGRAISLYLMAVFTGSAAGSLVIGWLCDVGGTELAFLVGGGAALVTMTLVASLVRDRHLVPRPAAAVAVGTPAPVVPAPAQAVVSTIDQTRR